VQRTIRRLTAREVVHAKPPVDRRALMLPDGGNLYLQVTRDRTHPDRIHRSWVFRYELDGHRHDLGIGSAPDPVDLATARERAKALRLQLLDGIDPLAAKQQIKRDRLARLAAEKRAMTFRQCAEACIASHEDGWSNAKHRAQWTQSLKEYAYPTLGNLAVDDITTAHVVRALEPIWRTIPVTASRVRARIEKVLSWAAVRGFRGGDNPARWRGHLAELFPAKGKMRDVEHFAAMPFSDVPAFFAELRQQGSLAARALELAILTAARSGEVLGATWHEIDLVAKTWTIPAKRMKAGKAHRVPLCDRAVAVLSALPRGDGLVFPLADSGNAMRELLQETRPGLTVHGFRSSFRDWAAERTNFPNHVVEAALAHTIPDKVEAAYRRGDLFEKRRRLMNDWAAWCARPVPSGATVTSIAGVR
jgi:integrase